MLVASKLFLSNSQYIYIPFHICAEQDKRKVWEVSLWQKEEGTKFPLLCVIFRNESIVIIL